jgi:hypothetical protein
MIALDSDKGSYLVVVVVKKSMWDRARDAMF